MTSFSQRDLDNMREQGVYKTELQSVRQSLEDSNLDESIFVLKLSQRYGLVSLNALTLVDCIAFMKKTFKEFYLEQIQTLIDEFSSSGLW